MYQTLRKAKPFIAVFAAVAILMGPTGASAASLFSDDFEQGGTSLTNGWTSFSGADTPSRTTSGDNAWAVNGGSKALLLQGASSGGHGNDPDDGAEREVATLGYSELTVQYSRAFENNLTTEDDEFVAEYSLDDGSSWTTLESVTPVNPATHSVALFDIANPEREAKLTLRFFLNGTATDDEAAVDDLEVTGEDPPLFYDGFESEGEFTGWTTTGTQWDEESGDVYVGTRKGEAAGSTGDTPDTLSRGISTEGYESLMVAYNYKISASLGLKDHVYSEWSLDGSNWTEINDHNSVVPGEWTRGVFALPASASDQSDFQLRFRADLGDGGDEIRIDDVMLWGTAITPSSGGHRVQYGNLVVEKYIRGGSASFGDFFFHLDGSSMNFNGRFETSGRNTFTHIPTDLYLVYEEESDGYAVTYEGDCEDGVVTVPKDETAVCRVINTYDGWQDGDGERGPEPTEPEEEEVLGVGGSNTDVGTLLVYKVIDGGPAVFGDFSFSIGSDTYDFWEAGMNSYELPVGNLSVVETPSEGYVPSYGGDCDENGNVTLGLGEVRTCIITNTYALGGYNPGETPQPAEPAAPAPHGGQNIGSSGDDGVMTDDDSMMMDDDAMTDDDAMASESDAMMDDAMAVSGTLSSIVPCSIGQIGWLLVNIILLAVVLFVWKDRRGAHWLATILLVIVALGMNSWAISCGLSMAWLPALLSLVAWLLMKLLGK